MVRLQQSDAHKSRVQAQLVADRQTGYPRTVFINGLVHSLNTSKLSTGKCTISLKAAVLPGHQLTGPSEEEEYRKQILQLLTC
jgi:hypothetical protein